MNQASRRKYADEVGVKIDRLRSKYLRRLYEALTAQVSAFTADVRNRGLTRAQADLYNTITNDRIVPLLNDIHVESGLWFGRRAWREISASITKAGFGFNEAWTEAILAWFQEDNFYTVSRITESTREQILSVLSQGVTAGESIEQMVRRLESPELLLWRARLIARTEIAKGAFVGRKIAADQSEFETDKEWISANDHRTRDSHRQVDGEVISYQSRFQVARKKGGADMMEGPGDPDASVENLANCRCSLATVVRVDANGRPIRKTRISVIQPGDFNRNRTTITI